MPLELIALARLRQLISRSTLGGCSQRYGKRTPSCRSRVEGLLQPHEVQVLRIGRESKTGLARQAEHAVVGGKRFADQPVEACARSSTNKSVEQEFCKPQAVELVCNGESKLGTAAVLRDLIAGLSDDHSLVAGNVPSEESDVRAAVAVQQMPQHLCGGSRRRIEEAIVTQLIRQAVEVRARGDADPAPARDATLRAVHSQAGCRRSARPDSNCSSWSWLAISDLLRHGSDDFPDGARRARLCRLQRENRHARRSTSMSLSATAHTAHTGKCCRGLQNEMARTSPAILPFMHSRRRGLYCA